RDPGVCPFRIFPRQPAGASRVLVCHRMWCHRRPPRLSMPIHYVEAAYRLLPPRQAVLGHGLLHLPAVEEAIRERFCLARHLQRHPARVSIMGSSICWSCWRVSSNWTQSSAGRRGGLRLSGPVPLIWGSAGSRMRSSFGVCPCSGSQGRVACACPPLVPERGERERFGQEHL